jgi:signal transduction histidine kinase
MSALGVYERIFEPLYSTKGFGIGLGLPVVKQIMEQHQGEQ